MYHLHRTCRACGSDRLVPVFDLGVQPLSNDFRKAGEECAGFAPLKVLFCSRCSLAQLSVVVRPDILYSRYSYVTSTSQMMRDHFSALAADIFQESKPKSLLEIGSNTGNLLAYFQECGVSVYGVEPATNLADGCNAAGIPTGNFFFDTESATDIVKARGRFDLVIARHVFCHVDNWKDFVSGLVQIGHEDTLYCIEVPYVKDLLANLEFDTIYHEHLSYLNLGAMEWLLRDTPLQIHKVVPYPIHGGAIVIMLRHRDFDPIADYGPIVESITEESWSDFEHRCNRLILEFDSQLDSLRHQGKRIAGYGASAKSTVWINFLHLTRNEIAFITDTTPDKVGTLSPGSDIPILDEGALMVEKPDYAIMFAWNYQREIVAKERAFLAGGGKFIVPLPEFKIIG